MPWLRFRKTRFISMPSAQQNLKCFLPCQIEGYTSITTFTLEVASSFVTAYLCDIGVAGWCKRGHGSLKFLENIVILCFERRLPKQNVVIRLQSNILAYPKFLGWLRHCYASFVFYNIEHETKGTSLWKRHDDCSAWNKTTILADCCQKIASTKQRIVKFELLVEFVSVTYIISNLILFSGSYFYILLVLHKFAFETGLEKRVGVRRFLKVKNYWLKLIYGKTWEKYQICALK